jgi:hypothetical protein
MPCDWQPTAVIYPATGMPFTEAGAWCFIAEKLREGHRVREIVLDKPQGKLAYVMEISLSAERPLLYVKIHLGGSGKVFGRSFHYGYR